MNQKLSENRAEAVREFLVKQAVQPDNIPAARRLAGVSKIGERRGWSRATRLVCMRALWLLRPLLERLRLGSWFVHP